MPKSNEIQAWTEDFEQKNEDRIIKMREEMENKKDSILKEIKSNKSASMATNPRSETNFRRNMQPSGSKTDRSNGVHASFDKNSDPDDEDYAPQGSKIKDLRHPAKLFYESDSDLDKTLVSERTLR